LDGPLQIFQFVWKRNPRWLHTWQILTITYRKYIDKVFL
jgi:hypothetical protein